MKNARWLVLVFGLGAVIWGLLVLAARAGGLREGGRYEEHGRYSWPKGCVGVWTFNEGGTKDWSGNGNDATLQSGATILNTDGGVLSCNEDYASVSAPVWSGTRPVSLCAWYQVSTVGAGDMRILEIHDTAGNNNKVSIYFESNPQSFRSAATDNGGTVNVANTNFIHSVGEWYYGVGIEISTTNRVTYVDGGPAGASNTNTVGAIQSLDGVTLGGLRFNGSIIQQWRGKLDEMMIFERRLSQKESNLLSEKRGGANR